MAKNEKLARFSKEDVRRAGAICYVGTGPDEGVMADARTYMLYNFFMKIKVCDSMPCAAKNKKKK